MFHITITVFTAGYIYIFLKRKTPLPNKRSFPDIYTLMRVE